MNAGSPDEIVITALGAVSAVGANAKNTCIAIKAGIVPFQPHAYVRGTPEDPDWDEDLPINVARVPFIDSFQNDLLRLQSMAIPVLNEVLGQSGLHRKDLAKTGLLLAMPSEDPLMAALGLNPAWLSHVQRITGLGGLALARGSDYGRVGFFVLVKQAAELLRSGKLKYCIVGGIDSYLFEQRLTHFDQQWRVKTARNVDGFVPGEATAMLMLETRAVAEARETAILAKILGLGFGEEEVSLGTNRASSGTGLTQAIRQAFESMSIDDSSSLQRVHAGLNGESYFAHEWGVVQTRLGLQLADINELRHPADSVGETGSALSALLVVNAASQINQSSKQHRILLFAANDDTRRAALILTNDKGDKNGRNN